jgi:hypothetical protein
MGLLENCKGIVGNLAARFLGLTVKAWSMTYDNRL